MDGATVTLVNQLSLAAAAIIACGVLWRAYRGAMDNVVAAKDKHLADLKEINQAGIFDLRARVMVLEDRAGVLRSDRNFYLEPTNAKGKLALDDLDGNNLK